MMEPISVIIGSTLTGLAVNFLSFVSKKSVDGLRELFSEDQLKSVLNRAFSDFKEDYVTAGGTADEEKLLKVFEDFFKDKRAVGEFQMVFAARRDDVDFNLLEEIFVEICITEDIDIPTFNFFRAVSHMVDGIDALAQKEETLRETFQTAHLDKIRSYLGRRGEESNITFARLKYLTQLERRNSRLQFTGIPDPREKKDIDLPSVFVMQRAVESVDREDYRRLMREQAHDGGFTGEELELRRLAREMPVRAEEKKPPVKFDGVLSVLTENQTRRFVVLGKPGSGKSSLLKYLLLEAARRHLEPLCTAMEPENVRKVSQPPGSTNREPQHGVFPILVEIRKFENALSKTTKPGYNILDFLYDSMRRDYSLTLPVGFFENYLESGRALLLFDGLDEVAAESRRAEVQAMIAAFTTGFHAGNTVIVTSRIAGYSRARFSTTDYRHFTLEDFNEEEIETFIRRWYGYRMTNPAEAETHADDLTAALKKKPRIRELAKNPLLLTIIAIIHRYEAQLPEDRLVLYDKATEALLYTWDNVKKIIDEKFKPDDKRRFLEKTAFHLQSAEKGDEAGTVIERGELYKILFPEFCRLFCCDNRAAKGHVDEFLENIRLRAGLLVEQSPDHYGFVHKTFQEYFAAQWVANEAKINFDLDKVIEYVDTFIDNAFWHETLLLALRALPAKQTLKVLEHILKRDPKEIEPHLYHNHYFVMKFIAEQGRWLINREFVQNQIEDFFRFSWNEYKSRSFGSHCSWDRFHDWHSIVSDSLAGSILYELHLSVAEDNNRDGYLRCSCAAAVGNLGLKEKAVDILINLYLAQKDKYSYEGRWIYDSLWELTAE